MTDIVIVAAGRTAVGKFGGTLAKIPAADWAPRDQGAARADRHRARGSLRGDPGPGADRGRGPEPGAPGGDRVRPAGQVPAMTINKVCGSGLKAMMLAAQAINAATPTSSSPAARRT